MGKPWPALDVPPDEILLAALHDFQPTAVEEHGDRARVYFATAALRDAARQSLTASGTPCSPIDVPDEDWAARSQQNLQPVTVGRVTIVPDSQLLIPAPRSLIPAVTIVIRPSIGFGTGHHATTRLCLAALQELNLERAVVLDVGTGSGILAIAAAFLGAPHAHAIDHDPDAVQSAEENLALNARVGHNVTFALADLGETPLPESDIVTANLTGAVLIRYADPLMRAVKPGGTLIVSGVLASEEDPVRRAFSAASHTDRRQEDEWICLILKKS